MSPDYVGASNRSTPLQMKYLSVRFVSRHLFIDVATFDELATGNGYWQQLASCGCMTTYSCADDGASPSARRTSRYRYSELLAGQDETKRIDQYHIAGVKIRGIALFGEFRARLISPMSSRASLTYARRPQAFGAGPGSTGSMATNLAADALHNGIEES